MAEWLAQYTPMQLTGLVGTVGGVLFLIITILSARWASVRRAELQAQQAEAELAVKQQMIERGMSADEIVRVLEAGKVPSAQVSKRKKDSAADPVNV